MVFENIRVFRQEPTQSATQSSLAFSAGDMTQAKIKKCPKENADREKANLAEQCAEEKQRPWFLQDSCVQVTAWILLTIGLCIIVITFYLSMHGNQQEQPHEEYDESYPDYQDNYSSVMLEMNKSVRGVNDDALDNFNPELQGCQELFCKVHCRKAKSIYEELFESLKLSSCQFMDVLVIDNQHWPLGVVKNNWPAVNISVREVMLSSSQVRRIRNGAFNAPIFSDTFLLSWRKLNLSQVNGGALLGLHSLKYLVIDTPVPRLDRAFFQPVQTTLTTLKLYAGLSVPEDYNIFGISQLNKLEYADLSYNNFNGPLTQKLLLVTPNLKYLIIANAKITYIERNAFDKLASKLVLLNLSQNLFRTVSADIFMPLLENRRRTFLNLAMNSWNCNCKLREFVRIYSKFRCQFIDTLYCRAPHRLYGTALDEVDFDYCDIASTTVTSNSNFEESDWPESTSRRSTTSTAVTISSTAANLNGSIGGSNSPVLADGDGDSEDLELPEETKVFQMRCLSSSANEEESATSTDGSVYSSSEAAAEVDFQLSDESTKETAGKKILKLLAGKDQAADNVDSNLSGASRYSSNLDFFEFGPPSHEFELQLLGNHSVQVTVADNTALMLITIIWFNEELESTQQKDVGSNAGYNCMVYNSPYLIVDDMLENTTYTFCLVDYNEQEITPFNCLPLHIPAAVQGDDNVWISTDDKAFTVGMLCLIFMLSIFFGAVVAYFGIKTYPDLLEGSKNVLVVKKPEQNCYVSTITETEYMTQASFKKKPPLSASMKQKAGLPETPNMPYSISAKDLERLPSVKSCSTYFEDAFVPISFPEDEYEMPTSFERDHHCKEHCVPNNYATSPSLPPPLPKRNSSIAESVLVNRFGQYN